MGQNASERAVRNAVLNSPIRELDGYRLAIDCGRQECGGERVYDLTALGRLHGPDVTVAGVVRRMRCQRCNGTVVRCAVETGPALAARGRMRRITLL